MNEKIIPFSYRRLADKKRVFPLFFSVLFFSGVLTVLSMTLSVGQGVLSLLAVVGLTVSVLIYHRYVVSDYTYSLRELDDGDAYLVFTKLVGKRESMLAALPLCAINSIEKFTKFDKNSRKINKKARKFNYAPTFSPDEFYVINAETRIESWEIIIEGSDELRDKLLEYAALAKEDYAREERERPDDEE